MNRRKFVKTMLYFLFGWLTRNVIPEADQDIPETGHRWETANPLEDLRAYDREVRPLKGYLVYDIPKEFRGASFLIARVTCERQI